MQHYALTASLELAVGFNTLKHSEQGVGSTANITYWTQFGSLNWEYTWIVFSKHVQELKVQVKHEILILTKSQKRWHSCSHISCLPTK